MASFFISYTGADLKWAEWVHQTLEDAGHDVTVQFDDFHVGSNFAARIHKALIECEKVVVLLSERSLAAEWVIDEWTNALASDLDKVRPIKVDACKPGGLLAARVYLDLTAVTDGEEAARQILKMLGPKAPAERVPYPGTKENGDEPTPGWPQYPPRGVFLDRDVLGRDEEVADLRRVLLDQQAAAILPATVLRGQGGIGKSTLARFYIERYRGHYRGIWWIKAESRAEVIAGLCDLARMLIEGAPREDSEALAEQAVQELQRTDGPWLVVYDNADTIGALRDLLPQRHDIHVLLTSRAGGWPARFAVHPTDKLPVPAAADLLEQESGRTDDRAGAERLAEELDGLPLALVCAGAWLRDVPGESFDGYIGRIGALLDHRPATVGDYDDSIFAAVSLSLDRLPDDARLLMQVFAFLAPDGRRQSW